MAGQKAQPATNERILRLLEAVRAKLAESETREQQIARGVARLLSRG
ncbi:MAG TPA: hypothetical protein VHF51_04155 [Solirubrobacteraceae bacterium]|nr:hypothetical protein [Solirubrobacteraceae bacterium]